MNAEGIEKLLEKYSEITDNLNRILLLDTYKDSCNIHMSYKDESCQGAQYHEIRLDEGEIAEILPLAIRDILWKHTKRKLLKMNRSFVKAIKEEAKTSNMSRNDYSHGPGESPNSTEIEEFDWDLYKQIEETIQPKKKNSKKGC